MQHIAAIGKYGLLWYPAVFRPVFRIHEWKPYSSHCRERHLFRFMLSGRLQSLTENFGAISFSPLGYFYCIAYASDVCQHFFRTLRSELKFSDESAAVDDPIMKAGGLTFDQAFLFPVVPWNPDGILYIPAHIQDIFQAAATDIPCLT